MNLERAKDVSFNLFKYLVVFPLVLSMPLLYVVTTYGPKPELLFIGALATVFWGLLLSAFYQTLR